MRGVQGKLGSHDLTRSFPFPVCWPFAFCRAPELCVDSRKAKYNNKVDVYSFGICMWAMIWRRRPFDEPEYEKLNVFGLVSKIVEGSRPSIPDDFPFNSSLVVELKYLLVRCWAANPDDRPDFQEIEQTLQQITEDDYAERAVVGVMKIKI